MVQFACWTDSWTLSTNPNNINVFPNPRWAVNLTSDEGEAGFVWPFDATDWKGFRVVMWTQNQNGTINVTRRLNGVDVGQLLSLTSPPSEPPFVPTIFTDVTVAIPVVKGDVMSYRWRDSNRSGVDMFATCWSFMEFPDGLWGF